MVLEPKAQTYLPRNIFVCLIFLGNEMIKTYLPLSLIACSFQALFIYLFNAETIENFMDK